MLKTDISDESGRVLVWTLVILGIGALLIPPLLASISTNLLATRAIEEDLKEQYAADAGVEQAIFRMSEGEYTLGESFDTPTLVNNLPVSVTITLIAADVYKIVSEAEDTRIESYVSTNYSDNLLWLLENAVTSKGDVIIRSGSFVDGDIVYSEEGDITGEEYIVAPSEAITMTTSFIEENWPSVSDLSEFYLMDVEDLPSLCTDIDVSEGTEAEPYLLGPLYCDGDLDILSSETGAVVKLSGTVYVTGQLNIGGPKDFTLDLNDQTIYVEYVGVGNAITIGGSCTISGSGCIIAVGDIYLAPKSVVSGDDDFVLIMSVNGTSKINPVGSFNGAVVGDAWVNLQPGNTLTWTSPYGRGLNFPTGSKGFMEFVTYRIY